MKVFISYNFLSNDKSVLKEKLTKISNLLENLGHTTFIHWRDKQNWENTNSGFSPKKIITNAFESIDGCDVLIAFTETTNKSQGMLLELGYAFAKEKKVILASVHEPSLRYVQSLAEKTYICPSFDELLERLNNYFTS